MKVPLLLAAGLCLPSCAAATAAPKARPNPLSSIHASTLKNGMRLIVWPDHDIPNVTMHIWYRVGARNEAPGITGLSHFFEHMMFNGAKKYGPGAFDRTMEAAGGANNAFTNEDVTVYMNWFPKSALETIFDLEADRIQNLSFDPKVIESERGVVASERRLRVDNRNAGLLMEQMTATAFVAHPYQIPVIGWPSDIAGWKHEDLVRYFKTYYAPNNAVMILTGDVTAEEALRLARKYLEPIPAQDPPEPIRTTEPEQLGERRISLEKNAQVPLLQMAWHTLPVQSSDFRALDLLMSILTRGTSSRLHQRLVEQENIALDVGGFNHEGFDPGLTWILATLASGKDPANAERIIDEEIARLIETGVTPEELDKAKNIFLADFWRALGTINGKAYALGQFEVFQGDYKALFAAPDQYADVTAEQVRAVAKKVFDKRHRTVGSLTPPKEVSP